MIVGGDAPPGRGCALACAPCSSAGPAAASAAPVRRMLRRSIRLPSAVGWLTICPSIAHRSHALRSLKIEAWLWPPVKETGPRRRRESYLARTDGWNCQRSRRLQEARRHPNQGLRDIEAAAYRAAGSPVRGPPPAAASTMPFWLFGGDSLRASGASRRGNLAGNMNWLFV